MARSPHRLASAWPALVAGSAALVLAILAAGAAWWVLSARERTVTYAVRGAVDAVALDLAGATVHVVGGGDRPDVAVERTERYAFGDRPVTARAVRGGRLEVRARCPTNLVPTCSSAYRVVVPDNVAVTVRTTSGAVRVSSFNGSARVSTRTGRIVVSSYCGFDLDARSVSADVAATAACAPERLFLRSGSGNVRAGVPAGSYRLDAVAEAGRRDVSGVTAAPDAPFEIQALSASGDVMVEGRR
jgi:hypothetical protein